jgi:DNA repair exonuclease SbcCD ATPase subunit/DNA repair exonuclease SbcCD nuclease subunit
MNVIQLESTLTTIDKIYHLADIHIRNLKRHNEYQTVFNRSVDLIKQTIGPNDIIFLGGDIVHAKTDMTPELVQAVQGFFKQFADLAPTILITGNHDCNLNNKSRLDALTPIVNALNHPNLYYLKDSGVYQLADKHFTVMSVFDIPATFIRADEFTADYKIALHHGAVDTAQTDVGFVLSNKHVTVDLFKGYDLTLLGDIHKPAQYLNKEKTVAYPGSLIQQNHGEALYHGYLVWNTNDKTSEFVEVPNDTCYYTLSIDNGVYTSLPNELLGKQVKLRIKVQNTAASKLETIISEVKSKFNITEQAVQKVNDFTNKSRVQKINIGDVRDVEYQNELITKYLKNKFVLSDEILSGIQHVNRTVNSSLSSTLQPRNKTWIPKKFEFSNMFSYGTSNIIDFANLKGVNGIFAPNASGKSTMLDALTYTIFDKCSRTSKAIHVLNNKAASFSAKFTFELDGIEYTIEKTGTKRSDTHVRIDINFFSTDETGEVTTLNGKERSETNDNIRAILGTYEDFILTALSVQGNNTGFIEMTQKERKDLLSLFLDISVFEDLYAAANAEIKEVAVLVKEYQKQDFSTKLASAITEIDKVEVTIESRKQEKDKLEKSLRKLQNDKLTLASSLIPISQSFSDITKLEDNKIQINNAISQLVSTITTKQSESSELYDTIESLTSQINSIDNNSLDEKMNVLNDLKDKEKTCQLKIQQLSVELRHKQDKMSKLDQLEYDENCSFCMNNIFVKDAIETKKSIQSDTDELTKVNELLKRIQANIKALDSVTEEKKELQSLQTLLVTKQQSKSRLDLDLHTNTSKLHTLETRLTEIESNITEYYKHEDAISANAKVNEDIDAVNSHIDAVESDLDVCNTELIELYSLLQNKKDIKLTAETSIAKLNDLEQQYKFYQYYMEAVDRDGVPYDLIASTIPYIEQEINNILSQIVDFSIALHTDGKNINAFIVYDQDNFWPIELTSGMEKFIALLAIRTSLINVSSLPRPNFLAIDEGFGALDSDNLNNMFLLFDYLKSQFSFLFVISHIDSMRDVVDSLVEITKHNGQSRIQYQ